MWNNFSLFFFVVVITCFLQCKSIPYATYVPNQVYVESSGRIEKLPSGAVRLIGSGASINLNIQGDSCTVFLRNETPGDRQNYTVFVSDGQYLGRKKIIGNSTQSFSIKFSIKAKSHQLQILKATVAQNGDIIYKGVSTQGLEAWPDIYKYKIEYIGNSITCAMGADTEEIPCGTDQWYDQHNAYFSYAAICSRELNAEFLLSSVSGIGIYRTWNRPSPDMPSVYNHLDLSAENNTQYNYQDFHPDLISICLGTNDLSDGDGETERLPFNQELFIKNYTAFVSGLILQHPDTKLALLNSPMVKGEKDGILSNCLQRVKENINKQFENEVRIFHFEDIEPHGCSYHPNITDHEKMAEQILPFYRKLLAGD